MKVNFFWSGDNFSYYNRLCVLSHIHVGHSVIIWLHGDSPDSKNWVNDLDITINDANQVFNVSGFLKSGGNFKTASSMWRFHFLYKFGGLYCDLDALAIKRFPNTEWILCSGERDRKSLSTGVIKAPSNSPVFLDSIKNIKKDWGNVKVFNESYKKYYKNALPTHDNKLFYPYNWKEWDYLFKDINIYDCYSIHLYHTMLERNNKIKEKEVLLKNKNTLIYKIIKKFDQ